MAKNKVELGKALLRAAEKAEKKEAEEKAEKDKDGKGKDEKGEKPKDEKAPKKKRKTSWEAEVFWEHIKPMLYSGFLQH